MKIVPILKCRNMGESISFYTRILGFALKVPGSTPSDPVVDLIQGETQIQLSVLRGDGAFGSAAIVLTEDVDELFKKFVRRGLDTSGKEESPVHQGPVDQSWGMREFYVTDPDGNTLRFGQPVRTK